MFRTDYCGFNVHNSDKDIINRPDGTGSYLFLIITCRMIFFFPGKKKSKNGEKTDTVIAESGACILYTPGFPQHYEAVGPFSNSFVHFYCEKEDLKDYNIPVNELFYPRAQEVINEDIRKIRYEYLSRLTHGGEMLDILIKELLIETERSTSESPEMEQQSELYSMMSEIRMRMLSYCNDKWNVEQLCEITHIGRSQFYHYYRSFFNTTPKDDLLQARIDRAKYLLTNRNMRINEVAEQSGFTNIYHFTRYFKKIVGCTPSKYIMQQNQKYNILG